MNNYGIIFTGSYTHIDVKAGAKITAGIRVIIEEFASLYVSDHGHLELGDYVYFNDHCSIRCRHKISIGKNTIFGDGVRLFDHNHLYSDYHVERFSFSEKPINIGENCWFGANCVILSGVTIGNNVIVGAGCVIHQDIPSNSIVYNEGNLRIRARRQSEHHCCVITHSDQIESLEYLLCSLPLVDFHVMAPCNASELLRSYNRYENFQLYTNAYEDDIFSLINSCDIVLDINHYSEVNNVLKKAIEQKKAIFAFPNTAHSHAPEIELFDTPPEMADAIKNHLKK